MIRRNMLEMRSQVENFLRWGLRRGDWMARWVNGSGERMEAEMLGD